MKVTVVQSEWDLGLNGSQFGDGHMGVYLTREEAQRVTKEKYNSVFDGEDEPFEETVLEGLISFNEIDI